MSDCPCHGLGLSPEYNSHSNLGNLINDALRQAAGFAMISLLGWNEASLDRAASKLS